LKSICHGKINLTSCLKEANSINVTDDWDITSLVVRNELVASMWMMTRIFFRLSVLLMTGIFVRLTL
jgi:hypothetical protein